MWNLNYQALTDKSEESMSINYEEVNINIICQFKVK